MLFSLMDLGILFSGTVPKASPRLMWTQTREMSDLSPGAGFGLVSTPCHISVLREAGY